MHELDQMIKEYQEKIATEVAQLKLLGAHPDTSLHGRSAFFALCQQHTAQQAGYQSTLEALCELKRRLTTTKSIILPAFAVVA